MLRTPDQVALLIAILYLRSGTKRSIRISEKTLRLLGWREKLRSAFVVAVISALEDRGLVMAELSSGGFGVIPASALEAGRVVTAKRLLSPPELEAVKNGQEIDVAALEEEWLEGENDSDQTDESTDE